MDRAPPILEIAEIDVTAGSEDAFEASVGQAVRLFEASPGCLSMRLSRSVEFPQRYRLFVGWASIEAHEQGFRGSAAFQEWRRLVSPHFAAPPRVEHVSAILDGFGLGPVKEA